MSQDQCTIYFSTSDPKQTISKIGKKLESLLQKKDIPTIGMHWDNIEDKERDKAIQIEGNSSDKLIEESLNYINSLPHDHVPFVSLYLDQAGETLYYCLVEGKVTEFSCLDNLKGYFDAKSDKSPEETFFSEFEQYPNLLLIRLKISGKKRMKEISQLCNDYIAEPSDNAFEKIKSYFDNSSEEEIDFPHLDAKKESFRGDVELARSLSFCMSQDKFIYLGFKSELLFDSAHPVIYSNQHSAVLNMLATFCYCKGIDSPKAKLWSSKKDANLEWFSYCVPGADFMCFEREKTPITLWNG